jgi:hypothetical protein
MRVGRRRDSTRTDQKLDKISEHTEGPPCVSWGGTFRILLSSCNLGLAMPGQGQSWPTPESRNTLSDAAGDRARSGRDRRCYVQERLTNVTQGRDRRFGASLSPCYPCAAHRLALHVVISCLYSVQNGLMREPPGGVDQPCAAFWLLCSVMTARLMAH